MKTRLINKNPLRKALTMMEMIISLAIMAVIFAAILPQFKNIQNSWASKQSNAETLQNGRILISHLNQNLAKAVQITAVSDPCDTTGYIEFEGNDGTTYRFDIGADNYVQFGPVGNLADLAGPVSQLQFTCYTLYDLDTPTTDVDTIRLVNVETILTNAGPGQDKNFTTAAYLQTNWFSTSFLLRGSYEFNHTQTKTPVTLNISGDYYLCTYTGGGDDGWAVVLKVNTNNWNITEKTSLEFDGIKGKSPALLKIDDAHYLCTYSGDGDVGWAMVLTVDSSPWTITKETSLNYDAVRAKDPALAKIDDEHYLCAYSGPDKDKGWAVVLTVDGATWDITKETPFEFDAVKGKTPALSKIDDDHYLCAYSGPDKDKGWAVVLTVDGATRDITKETPFEFDAVSGKTPVLAKVDDEHYFCAYSGPDKDKGWAVVLTVNNTTWNIAKGTPLEFDSIKGKSMALAEIQYLQPGISDQTNYLCAYTGDQDIGYATILSVDETTWAITPGIPNEYNETEIVVFEDDKAKTPGFCAIDSTRFLCVYSGTPPKMSKEEKEAYEGCLEKDHGWSVVFDVHPPLEP